MPLRLEIKSKLAQRSERVKSVDLHPTEPWIRVSLYSGSVGTWDYQSQVLEVIGEEEGHREADEVDADESTDGDVLVNRDNDDEEYGTSNEGNLRA